MAPDTLAEAERLILADRDLEAVCEALGCTRRTLERAFVAAHGTTPARWRRAQRGGCATTAAPLPPVFFRLPDDLRRELRAVAEADGVGDNAWCQALAASALRARREAR